MAKIYDELLATIEGLQIIDTHEHLPSCEANRDQQCDVLAEWLLHYFWCDLVSAGLPREAQLIVRDSAQDLKKRW